MEITLSHTYTTPEQDARNSKRAFSWDIFKDHESTVDYYKVSTDHALSSYGQPVITLNGEVIPVANMPDRLLYSEPTYSDKEREILSLIGFEGCDWECGYPRAVRRIR